MSYIHHVNIASEHIDIGYFYFWPPQECIFPSPDLAEATTYSKVALWAKRQVLGRFPALVMFSCLLLSLICADPFPTRRIDMAKKCGLTYKKRKE